MAELYAIVGDMERARFMLAARVPYLQLRFKAVPLEPHRKEIATWPEAFPATRLIINDDLAFAEAVGAWGVHLGQEDVLRTPREALLRTPLKVGISTHSDEEIRAALELSAAMLGFGPMYATTTKQLTHAPQGAARLRQVVERVQAQVPIVAIGGINDGNLDEVVATGVAMVAMIAYLDQFTTAGDLNALMARLRG